MVVEVSRLAGRQWCAVNDCLARWLPSAQPGGQPGKMASQLCKEG